MRSSGCGSARRVRRRLTPQRLRRLFSAHTLEFIARPSTQACPRLTNSAAARDGSKPEARRRAGDCILEVQKQKRGEGTMKFISKTSAMLILSAAALGAAGCAVEAAPDLGTEADGAVRRASRRTPSPPWTTPGKRSIGRQREGRAGRGDAGLAEVGRPGDPRGRGNRGGSFPSRWVRGLGAWLGRMGIGRIGRVGHWGGFPAFGLGVGGLGFGTIRLRLGLVTARSSRPARRAPGFVERCPSSRVAVIAAPGFGRLLISSICVMGLRGNDEDHRRRSPRHATPPRRDLRRRRRC